MIGAPVPGVINALQVTIPGRSLSVPRVKALGNARDEKKALEIINQYGIKGTGIADDCSLLLHRQKPQQAVDKSRKCPPPSLGLSGPTGQDFKISLIWAL